MKYLKLFLFHLIFLHHANCKPCVIDTGDGDIIVGPILPAKATDSVFSTLATINRLFQDAKLKLFHLDASGAFGVIELDANGNHLFVFDPTALDDVKLELGDKPIKESRLLKVRTYGITVTSKGKDAVEIENREIVVTTPIGAVIKLDDESRFTLSCSVAKFHEKGGFRLLITRNDNGEWRAKVDSSAKNNDAPADSHNQEEVPTPGSQRGHGNP